MKNLLLSVAMLFLFTPVLVHSDDGFVDTTKLLVLTRSYIEGNDMATRNLEKGKMDYAKGMEKVQEMVKVWQVKSAKLKGKSDKELELERIQIEELHASVETGLQQSILSAQEILTAGSMSAIREIHQLTGVLAEKMNLDHVWTSAGLAYFNPKRTKIVDLTPLLIKEMELSGENLKSAEEVARP